jgi:hypothetical protein
MIKSDIRRQIEIEKWVVSCELWENGKMSTENRRKWELSLWVVSFNIELLNDEAIEREVHWTIESTNAELNRIFSLTRFSCGELLSNHRSL